MSSWSSLGGLGRSRGLCWRSCATLGAYVGGLGSGSGAKLALCWRSWAVLGPYVGSPEPLLVPMFAVLGRLGA